MDAELEDGNRGATSAGSVGNVKVDWNLTGTVVSTAGDDAKVRLWKCEYSLLSFRGMSADGELGVSIAQRRIRDSGRR